MTIRLLKDNESGEALVKVASVFAIIAAIIAVLEFGLNFNLFEGGGGFGNLVADLSDSDDGRDPFGCDASISVSDGSAPSGTTITVTGSGFLADEEVELRFHTISLTPGLTNADGGFEQDVRIPGDFDGFAPQQFALRARTGACSDDVSFQLEE